MTQSPGAIDRRTSGERVADAVRAMLWNGEVRPGDRLGQVELASQLSMSRIPVRDGLHILERQGLVIRRENRGVFVAPIDADSATDHYTLYGLVYGLALEKAVERSTPEALENLAVLARATSVTRTADKMAPAMSNFLVATVHAARSPRVLHVARNMVALVPGNFFVEVPGSTAHTRRGMGEVADQLDSASASKAGESLRALLQGQGPLVVARLVRRGIAS